LKFTGNSRFGDVPWAAGRKRAPEFLMINKPQVAVLLRSPYVSPMLVAPTAKQSGKGPSGFREYFYEFNFSSSQWR
jgi:hypothetical protein